MAIVTNTFTTYGAKGNREDLSDVIYNIDPTETPVVSQAARPSMKAALHEWQVENLGAVDTANAHLEGDDIASFPALTPTVRVGNYAQIMRKLALVSDTQEEVDKAGRRSEMAHQLVLKGLELRRDKEAIVLANQGGNAGGTGTARTFASFGAWLKSNTDFASGNGGADPSYTSGVPSAGRTDDGTPRVFAETQLTAVLAAMYNSGANINACTMYTGTFNRAKASAFAGIADQTVQINADAPTSVIASADVYVSDFGKLKIMADRFQRGRDVWILDPEFYSLPVLRSLRQVKLAKTGDAEKRMVLEEGTLKVHNEAAHGGIFDLTTS